MKKFFLSLMFVVALAFTSTCAAKDVWIDHWGSEGVDIYVMDDTIVGNSSGNGFSVVTKEVRNGRLLKNVKWIFDNARGSWRYETSTMNGNHTSIVYNNKIFEFCMNRLGWSYHKRNGYYD